MRLDDAITAFSSLAPAEKAELLAGFAYELTVVARDTYEVGRDGLTSPAAMRAINEIQHRVTAFLWALLRDDPRRYPDDVLVRIIHDPINDPSLERQIAAAFGRCFARPGAAAG